METIEPLDKIDIRILEILQEDATTSNADIALQINSSKTVVWRRIQRMLDAGIIKRRVAVLDHRQLGFPMLVFAHVKMARHGRDALASFMKTVGDFPEVLECHCLMGHVDFLLKIAVRSLEDYEWFIWHKLSQLDGVQEVTSSMSLSQGTNSGRLPLTTTAPKSGADKSVQAKVTRPIGRAAR